MTRHWTAKDFIVTATSPAYDDSGVDNRFGYCRVCKGDMQSFRGGPILHHNSHQRAKRLGLWGKVHA